MKNLICLVLFIYICLFNHIKSEAYFENTTPEMIKDYCVNQLDFKASDINYTYDLSGRKNGITWTTKYGVEYIKFGYVNNITDRLVIKTSRYYITNEITDYIFANEDFKNISHYIDYYGPQRREELTGQNEKYYTMLEFPDKKFNIMQVALINKEESMFYYTYTLMPYKSLGIYDYRIKYDNKHDIEYFNFNANILKERFIKTYGIAGNNEKIYCIKDDDKIIHLEIKDDFFTKSKVFIYKYAGNVEWIDIKSRSFVMTGIIMDMLLNEMDLGNLHSELLYRECKTDDNMLVSYDERLLGLSNFLVCKLTSTERKDDHYYDSRIFILKDIGEL